MRDPDVLPRYQLSGDIAERGELLNGSVQLALDGAAVRGSSEWQIAVTLAWRLGREGAVALDEGDLALDDGVSALEVIAILEEGTAEEDTDTGNSIVELLFTIEESTVEGFEVGTQLRAEFDIGAEQWSGSLTIGGGAA
jgi:hypothetical protein